jgi:hypothetical protein
MVAKLRWNRKDGGNGSSSAHDFRKLNGCLNMKGYFLKRRSKWGVNGVG